MKQREPRFFAATTPGRTATRWLSVVLASHPDVFVAHGKFALDSVSGGTLKQEKETANIQALSRGNSLRALYESRPLEEILHVYQEARPEARALGCVHSYSLHALAQAARHPKTLDQMHVINVVRHPVDFLASHYSLVRAAEKHPELYRYYLDEVFPQTLQEFPELYLLKCPDIRAFVAFAISCHTVNNLLYDFCYPGTRHLKMEALTTQVDVLHDFCAELTGLDYPGETLEGFIRQGPINQLRPATATRDPHAVYAAWEPWQQDMAHMMISGLVLDWLEKMGYDLGMFRARMLPPSSDQGRPQLSSFADCLRSVDQKHPLLVYMNANGYTRIQKIEADHQGFQLAYREGKMHAWARSLEPQVVAGLAEVTLDEQALEDLQDAGLYIQGNSLGEIWWTIARVVSGKPVLIEEYCSFNVIRFRDVFYAVLHGVAVDFERLKTRQRKQLLADKQLFMGETAEDVKEQLDAFLEEYRGFNIVKFRQVFYAVRLGVAVNFERLKTQPPQQLLADDQVFVGQTVEDIKKQIDAKLWPEEMRRQQDIVNSWPPLHRWLWTTRKRFGRLKRVVSGEW
jgi:hypothetical protein